jgi:hypothetical protein
MVLPDQHLRPDVLAKINEVSRCALLGFQELETELKAKQFLFGVLRGTRFVCHGPGFEIFINIPPDRGSRNKGVGPGLKKVFLWQKQGYGASASVPAVLWPSPVGYAHENPGRAIGKAYRDRRPDKRA